MNLTRQNFLVAILAFFLLSAFPGFCQANDCQMIIFGPEYATPSCQYQGGSVYVKRELSVKWKFKSDEPLPLASGTYYLHSRYLIQAVQVDSMGYINSEAQTNFGIPGIYIFYPEITSGTYDCNFQFLSTSSAANAAPIPNIYVSGGIVVPWSITGGSRCGWTFQRPVVRVAVKISGHPDCSDCNSGLCSAGRVTTQAGSVSIQIDAGKSRHGTEGNKLSIRAEYPTSSTYQPAGIQFDLASDTWVYRETTRPGNPWPAVNDSLVRTRQVLTADTLVDITTASINSMELKFYHAVDKGTLGSDGYQPTVSPFRRVIIENPGTSVSENSLVRVSEFIGTAAAKVMLYTWNEATKEWRLDNIDAGTSESASSVWDANHVYRLDTYKKFLSSTPTVVLETSTKTYKDLPFGESLVDETTGTGLDATSVQYTYYEVSGAAGYGEMKSKTSSTGYWERYEYESATTQNSGRRFKTVKQVGNNLFSSSDAANRIQITSFDDTQQIETEIETIQGVEVSRRYRTRNVSLNQTQEISCTVPGAAINNASNLITKTTLVTGGTFANEVARIERPDGTITTYDYVINGNGGKTTEEKTGEANATKTSVVSGKKTVTVVDVAGNLQSESVYDFPANILIEQKLVNATDAFGRPSSVSYLDGTYETFTYGCCGLDSQRDRTGITTTFTYNSRNLLEDEVSDGVTNRHLYDAAGRETSITRQPANTPIIMETKGYDTAGKLNSSKDALTHETTYSDVINGSGYQVKTTTYPNTGTRIETYNQDGTLLSVAGTASRPAFYEYGTWSSAGQQGEFTKEYLGVDNTVGEWRSTYTDMVGRVVKMLYPDGASEQSVYNNLGQLTKSIDADNVTTLYAYNSVGEEDTVAVDVNANGMIDLAGTDRVTKTTRNYTSIQEIVTTQQYWNNADATPTTVSATNRNLSGLISSQTQLGLPTTTQVALGSNGLRSVTTTFPDNSYLVQDYVNTRQTAENRYAADNTRISSVTYGYIDPHLRRTSATDARNGTTDYTYTVRDELKDITTPAPESGKPRLKTAYTYNVMGQVLTTTLPDNSVTSNTNGRSECHIRLTDLSDESHLRQPRPFEDTGHGDCHNRVDLRSATRVLNGQEIRFHGYRWWTWPPLYVQAFGSALDADQ